MFQSTIDIEKKGDTAVVSFKKYIDPYNATELAAYIHRSISGLETVVFKSAVEEAELSQKTVKNLKIEAIMKVFEAFHKTLNLV